MALASYPPSSFSFFENGLSEQLSLIRWFTRTCSLWKSTAHGSPQWLVGSYPTFSPLPLHWHLAAEAHHAAAVVFFCSLPLSPAASIFRSRALFAARTFLSPPPLSLHQHHTSRCNRGLAVNCEREKKASDKPGHCLTTCKSNKTFSFNNHLLRYIFYFEEGKSR